MTAPKRAPEADERSDPGEPGIKGSRALVIDDEPDLRALMAVTLERLGVETHVAANLEEARNLIERYRFDVCLTDMRLPDGNGVGFVAELAGDHPTLPVAVITAHGQMDAAVEAMKNGAFDFVSKPVDLKILRNLVSQAIRSTSVPERTAADRRDERAPSAAGGGASAGRLLDGHLLVGSSEPMATLRERIRKVARSNAPVWITGESGTGKELVAKLIHRNGARASAPFVAVNCGAIPADLMESEFFGHRKGSFTGAHNDSPGLFRSADGGTLFLDEVAELPLPMQAKLLRAIQERSVRPVGASEEIPTDVRIISASHADLAEQVRRRGFRADLYYRLDVISIRTPSLRERIEDIAVLAGHMLDEFAAERSSERTSRTMRLGTDALAVLREHPFDGNVRELRNIMERAFALIDEETIDARHMSGLIGRSDTLHDDGASTARNTEPGADAERERLLAALEENRWNRRRAAEQLGLSYRQLRYRIERLDLDDDSRAA